MSDRPPATPEPAATVLLVRDGAAGLEVFVVERHSEVNIAGGATVFPGGKVDPEDRHPAVLRRAEGLAGLDEHAATLRVAAVREVFEEAGVVLARPRGAAELVPPGLARELAAEHAEARRAGEVVLAPILEAHDLVLACDLLGPFAHWITPEPMRRRFDTHFFLAPTPPGQQALHDGGESVRSHWIAPARVLEDADAGRRSLMFPTRMNLGKLARFERVSEALEAARRTPVVSVCPRIERTERGVVLRIPAEAGYDLTEIPVERVPPLERRGAPGGGAEHR